jgi:hypothetical protein
MAACGSASQWACVNIAIALSIHVRTANGAFREMSPYAWAYFKNAYALFPELMLQGNDIETVKALALMAMFGRNSADARTTSLFLSTALRISQTLDTPCLSRVGHGKSCNAAEAEDARLTLWTAFVLDAELSLCCGLSSGVVASDTDIDLPNEKHPYDGDDEACVSIFRQRVQLALIHSAARTRLYSPSAFKMPESELLSTVATLDQGLEDWGQNLPPDAQPGPGGMALQPHCVMLHLAFHNATSMTHWAARRHSAWDVGIGGGLQEQSLSLMNLSRLKVRAAAQHTLRLVRESPSKQCAEFWYDYPPQILRHQTKLHHRRTLCYPLSAAMTLLLYILDCPEDPEAEADARLLGEFGLQIKRIHDDGDFQISNLITAYHKLEQLAHVAINQAQNAEGLGAATELSQDACPHNAVQVSHFLYPGGRQ